MSALTEITDQLTLVVLGIRIWSGRKKLRAEDLHLSDGEIPPEELVSLGSKRVCDPEPLKEAIAAGKNRILLTLTTGTGKTRPELWRLPGGLLRLRRGWTSAIAVAPITRASGTASRSTSARRCSSA